MDAPQKPYQPPDGRVADVPEPPEPPRPRAVTIAVWLLVSAVVLELVGVAIDWRDQSNAEIVIFTAIAVTVMLCIVAWLIFMLGRRRNWARLVYAIFFVIGLSTFVAPGPTLEKTPLELLITIVQGVLQFVAVVLTYLPVSNAWYRSGRENRL
jgi:hypothetical protein